MTETSISLLSILIGIATSVIFVKFNPKYTLGFAGNCIVGVFGRLFYIAPNNIVIYNSLNPLKLIANLFVSGTGGIVVLLLIKKVKN